MPNSRILLLVEDSQDDYVAFRRACASACPDVEVQWCRDVAEARAAVAAFQDKPGRTWPVLVLDLNMPGVDGRSFLRELKSGANVPDLPVVIYSTSNDADDVSQCYRLAANAYHVKPLEFETMKQDLQRIVHYWFDVAVRPRVQP